MKHMLTRIFPRLLLTLLLLPLAGLRSDSAGLKAQDTIGFNQSSLSGWHFQVNAGDSVTFGAYLHNQSMANPFYDSIQISGYIDTGAAPIPFSFPIIPNVYIGANSDQFFIGTIHFFDNYQSGMFRIGGNTIVIWPTLYDPNFNTGDSLTATVIVIDTINSVGPEPPAPEVRCYPVPASGPLYITGPQQSSQPVSVIVRDNTGRIIATAENPSQGIDTEPWAPGIYLLEIYFENGDKSYIKVMRQ